MTAVIDTATSKINLQCLYLLNFRVNELFNEINRYELQTTEGVHLYNSQNS